ncbi:MAG: cysteate synthase [Bacteroidota bacterium]
MSISEIKTSYKLQSPVSGKIFEDTGWMLEAPGEKPSLLRSVYAQTQLSLGPDSNGLFRFADWLPVKRMLNGSSAPVTFKSSGLAQAIGLKNLYITFSGYWPDKGATMRTCSFKETEAYSVCARLEAESGKTLVVASAGNTARAFARVCSDNLIPLLLCVPFDVIDALWFDEPLNDCVRLICTPAGSDYFDAIHLSNLACQIDGFIPEGGAKNIARRDGMATTVLSATTFIGKIPDYYFQAVGSGTGAIAAWEANLRLIHDKRFGDHKMKLILSQNNPFLPMVKAWEVASRELLPIDDDLARDQIRQIKAKVLSNRKPPYSIAGGLFDALSDCGGKMFRVSNEELEIASQLFLLTEGIDLHPAAAVATASLMQFADNYLLSPDSVVMLNITGGGEALFKKEKNLFFLKPFAIIEADTSPEQITPILTSGKTEHYDE